MENTIRIGLQLESSDAFWVQVGMAIEQQARHLDIDLITFDIDYGNLQEGDYLSIVEELQIQEIKGFIVQSLPAPLIKLIRNQNIPVILLNEQPGCHEQKCNHPGMVCPFGLYWIAQMLSQHLIKELHVQGTVLVIGGLATHHGDDGRNRLAAIYNTFENYNSIQVSHIPSLWRYDQAYPQILAEMQKLSSRPNVIFGLSDSLALTARKAAEELGLLTPETIVVGINGDPEALAAISSGTMAATVDTPTVEFGKQAVELALKAALGQPLTMHFSYKPRLITRENAAEVTAQKLIAIAELPNRLVGFNRRREQQRMTQLETNLAVNRQIGAILDRQELTQTIVNLIRSNYNFDRVQFYLWSEATHAFMLDDLDSTTKSHQVMLQEDAVLSEVLMTGELIFVPDMRYNQRFRADPQWPQLRSRIILPVRFGGTVLGVLDLHRDCPTSQNREQLMGLQLLADQLAIAIHNAELYSEALAARKAAEKADNLKTRLLANVSHELRTPLNIILGYTKAALNELSPFSAELAAEITSDLSHVYQSGEHLLQLINDLLALSLAEIDELEISPEIMDLQVFLEDVFNSIASATSSQETNIWQLEVPQNLPLLQADPMRLRQVLLNLLSNASKFTRNGKITLGADVQPPYMHIWVKDTGQGISADQQASIFEPFVIGEQPNRHTRGIGLGLSISRRLVMLHQGIIKVESRPNLGSTFHIYIPLPNLSGQFLTLPEVNQGKQNLVWITNRQGASPEKEQLSQREDLCIYQLRPADVRQQLLELNPSILVWDSNNATKNDWTVLDYLRTTPQLAQLPFMLYKDNSPEGAQSSLTNILLKPFNYQTLTGMLEILCQKEGLGEILIVDDDIQSLNMYHQLVKEALPGYTINLADNGTSAITILKQLIPGLVIIDLVMPEVNGFEVIEWLRTNLATRNVPVLVISGKVLSPEDIQNLDFSRVIYQTKDILHSEEATNLLQQVAGDTKLLTQSNSMLVKRTIAYLQQNYSSPLTLKEIAHEMGISKNYLGEIFHQETGISPWEYLNRFRVKQARFLLKTTDLSITSIANEVGLEDPAYFSRVFRAIIGQSPKAYRGV
ncbi:MAG: two-component hybrid sensor and regulator [Chloroflexi bacterium]|nr:two-component hybrid sensor and regulator [Chloroflexota bacterium]